MVMMIVIPTESLFAIFEKQRLVDPQLIEFKHFPPFSHASVLCANTGSIWKFFVCVSNDWFKTPLTSSKVHQNKIDR